MSFIGQGIALNLENENVSIVIFGSDTAIKEGSLVKRTGSVGVPIDGKGALSEHLLEREHFIYLFGEGKDPEGLSRG